MRLPLCFAALVLSGCFTTTRYQAADIDALDDDDIAELVSCRARCEAASPGDFVDCYAQCPSVVAQRGEACEHEAEPLCVERRQFDPRGSRDSVGAALLSGGVVLSVLAVLAAQDFGESLGAALGETLAGAGSTR